MAHRYFVQYGLFKVTSKNLSVVLPEDLLAERTLMAVYPQPNEEARVCAEKLMAVFVSGALPVDWIEVERVASLPEYDVLEELLFMRDRVKKVIG